MISVKNTVLVLASIFAFNVSFAGEPEQKYLDELRTIDPSFVGFLSGEKPDLVFLCQSMIHPVQVAVEYAGTPGVLKINVFQLGQQVVSAAKVGVVVPSTPVESGPHAEAYLQLRESALGTSPDDLGFALKLQKDNSYTDIGISSLLKAQNPYVFKAVRQGTIGSNRIISGTALMCGFYSKSDI